MRLIKTYKWVTKNGRGSIQRDATGELMKEFNETAKFHCFGVDFEEFESGPANYTTAVVEYEDGRVEGLPLSLVQFVEE